MDSVGQPAGAAAAPGRRARGGEGAVVGDRLQLEAHGAEALAAVRGQGRAHVGHHRAPPLPRAYLRLGVVDGLEAELPAGRVGHALDPRLDLEPGEARGRPLGQRANRPALAAQLHRRARVAVVGGARSVAHGQHRVQPDLVAGERAPGAVAGEAVADPRHQVDRDDVRAIAWVATMGRRLGAGRRRAGADERHCQPPHNPPRSRRLAHDAANARRAGRDFPVVADRNFLSPSKADH